jgi:hypothetical protein
MPVSGRRALWEVSFQHFSVLHSFSESSGLRSHGDVADELENTGLNQWLMPFWTGLQEKFSVSRDYTFDWNTLPSSEDRVSNSTVLGKNVFQILEKGARAVKVQCWKKLYSDFD